MPGYNRFVSYLYNYEKQIKSDNVGYARVETRNGQCKITIHFKVLNLKVNTVPVYVCIRKKGRLQGVMLGDITINRGIGEMQFTVEEENVMNSGLSLSAMACMVIYYSEDKFYGTEWDDESINIRGFKQYEKDVEHIEEKMIDKAEEKASLPEVISEEKKEAEEPQVIELSEKPQELEETEEPTQEAAEEISETIQAAEIGSEANTDPVKLNAAEKIFLKCPSIQPFEEGKVISCVKFLPEDIGLLPMEYWSLGSNSFLMHGYFNYRHLIFAKKTNGNKITYLLGVPGIQEKNEESLAAMFGFRQFVPLRRQVNEQRELGYWYMPINI